MKYLVIVLLAASACAAEIEKREADPGYGSYRPSYGSGYGHPYGVHPHYKRSADPEPEPEASNPSRDNPVNHLFGANYGKRSIGPNPYPYAEPSYDYGYQYPSYYSG
ncbi:uncharacterized protein LOC135217848 [Macrobrachium nipponense]|uniref:uncharacterized protein LOC135217848 n=1 Tax=Macrobrachium nipponense TaxID=159736 RepID=UPI0030C8BAEA